MSRQAKVTENHIGALALRENADQVRYLATLPIADLESCHAFFQRKLEADPTKDFGDLTDKEITTMRNVSTARQDKYQQMKQDKMDEKLATLREEAKSGQKPIRSSSSVNSGPKEKQHALPPFS